MHILFIAASYPSSYRKTSGIFFKEQAEAVAKTGNKTGLISVNYTSLRYVFSQRKISFPTVVHSENNVNTIINNFPLLPGMRKSALRLKLALGKKLFKQYVTKFGMPDIIHQHTYEDGLLTNYIKSRYNIPYVLTEHYTHFFGNKTKRGIKSVAKKSYENSSFNMCVGKKLQETLKFHFQKDFSLVPNLINTDIFTPKSDKNISVIEKFVSIGGLIKRKNFDNLIKAFSPIMKSNPKIRLTIAGDGEEKKNLQNLINELGLQQQITLFGQANRDEVLTLLQNSDCFIMSSLRETFGVVLIEAMSCGLPVISVKNGGAENIITDAKLGILCNSDNASMQKAIEKIRTKKYSSEFIRNHIIQNFSEKAVTAKWVDIYKKVLESYT